MNKFAKEINNGKENPLWRHRICTNSSLRLT